MGILDSIENSIHGSTADKSYSDKLLGREEYKKMQAIIKKERLSRQDINELLYSLNGVEIKLANFQPNQLYIVQKLYIWIKEVCTVYESLASYAEKDATKNRLTPNSKILMEQCLNHLDTTTKFMIDAYLMFVRSSMAQKGKAFDSFMKQKYEIDYRLPTPQKEEVGKK